MRYNRTPEERFHEKYIIVESGCWEWQAASVQNYGVININHKAVRAHRFSYEIHKGPIPAGLDILHSCDNPCCVNPDHLRAGTHQENMVDRAQKGRYPKDGYKRQEFCRKGHLFDEVNSYYRPGTRDRTCKICMSVRNKKKNTGKAPGRRKAGPLPTTT